MHTLSTINYHKFFFCFKLISLTEPELICYVTKTAYVIGPVSVEICFTILASLKDLKKKLRQQIWLCPQSGVRTSIHNLHLYRPVKIHRQEECRRLRDAASALAIQPTWLQSSIEADDTCASWKSWTCLPLCRQCVNFNMASQIFVDAAGGFVGLSNFQNENLLLTHIYV